MSRDTVKYFNGTDSGQNIKQCNQTESDNTDIGIKYNIGIYTGKRLYILTYVLTYIHFKYYTGKRSY